MLEDGLVDAQDESARLETLFLTALRHIVNLEDGFTGPMPEREAREAVARTFIGGLWKNSCKHKDSPLPVSGSRTDTTRPYRVRVHAPS